MWYNYNTNSYLIYISAILIYSGHTFEDSSLSGTTKEIENSTKLNVVDRIKFFLYTRKNPILHEQLEIKNLFYLKWTQFDPKRPIKILVHGWKCSYRSAYNLLLKNAFLTQYNANIIIIDWHDFSQLSYPSARRFVSSIADVLAGLIDRLCDEFKINPDSIHMVGHSLGAHVAGIAGLRVKNKINRITGLDPAGPFFYIEDDERISTESAKFVDIIHTDGGLAGFYHPLGHVDFYPNGGTAIQPGCGFDALTLKSHRRAYWLFAESITTTDGFSAVKCDSWADFKKDNCKNVTTFMGEHVSTDAQGKYYLRTNSRSPYALETAVKRKTKID